MGVPARVFGTLTRLKLGAEFFLVCVFFMHHEITNDHVFLSTLVAYKSSFCNGVMIERTEFFKRTVGDVYACFITFVVLLSMSIYVLFLNESCWTKTALHWDRFFMVVLCVA